MRVPRLQVAHPSGGPCLVKKSEQDSTDVNLIMNSWIRGAPIPGVLNPAPGRYGDFSSGLDYRSALTAVRDAETAFAAMPPKVRNHCDNDPGKLLDMFYDPERREELVALGLVEAPPEVVPKEEKGAAAPEEGADAPEDDSAGANSPAESDLT